MLSDKDYIWLRATVKGWKAKKMALYGVRWPPPKGWRKKLLKEYEIAKGAIKQLPSVEFDKPIAISVEKLNEPAWHYSGWDAEAERISMKKLYQEKSGDYSY